MIGIALRGAGPVEELVRALQPLRTTGDANHNYSVWLSDSLRVFQRLQWGGCNVVRTRDPNRFGRALAFHLAGHGAPPPGVIRTDGVVVIHGSTATVLPGSFRQRIAAFERPLRQAGILFSDAPWVDVDPQVAEVVLPQPPPLATEFRAAMDRLPPARRQDPLPEPGRYPVAGWFFAPLGLDQKPMSVVDAVAAVLSSLHRPLAQAVDPMALAAMFARTTIDRPLFATPQELLSRIRM